MGKKRWVDAVETVLSQSSNELPPDSLVGRASSYVSSPKDSMGIPCSLIHFQAEKNLKGILFLVGICCGLGTLLLAVESYLISTSSWSIVLPGT